MVLKRKKPKYWIFQSNPTKYDLIDDIKTGDPDPYWSANQHRNEVSVGEKISSSIIGDELVAEARSTALMQLRATL